MSEPERSSADLESFIDILRPMVRQGIELFPLKPRSKVPEETGYLQKRYAPAEIKQAVRRGCNVAVNVKESHLLVLDIDPRNGGDTSLAKLRQEFNLPYAPTVQSGRGDGGHHIYYLAPEGMRLPTKVAAYPGIDFKSSGHVVAPGSIHPDTGKPYTVDSWLDFTIPIPNAPAELVAALGRPVIAKPPSTATPSISKETLATLLSVLDPRDYASDGPEDWFRLMCACHDATAGDGIEEFIEWCAGDPAYADEHHMQMNRRRWASVTAAADSDIEQPATKATLFRAVAQAGHARMVATLGLNAAGDFDADEVLDRFIGEDND